jgi:hypothetical protein
MFRPVSFAAIAVLTANAAQAQTPAPDLGRDPAKIVKVHAELRSGGAIEVRQPAIIDKKLCGFVLPAGGPADAMPKADCIAMNEISSTRVEGAKFALAESTEGALCAVLMPLCLAKVSAVQERIAEKAIEKARAQ